MRTTPYLCTCADCGHRFSSSEIPFPKRRGLLASIFSDENAVMVSKRRMYLAHFNIVDKSISGIINE